MTFGMRVVNLRYAKENVSNTNFGDFFHLKESKFETLTCYRCASQRKPLISAQIHHFRRSFCAMNGIFDGTKIADSGRMFEKVE